MKGLKFSNALFLILVFSVWGCGRTAPKLQGPIQKVDPVQVSVNEIKVEVNSKTDILFVIDNSLSMDPHQENLARNIDGFVNAFSKNQFLDFHIGMVPIYDSRKFSTPETRAQYGITSFFPLGQLLPLKGLPDGAQTTPYITRETPDYTGVLRQTLRLGTQRGPEWEESFSPVLAALSADPHGPNGDFYRSDAYLVVVFITDGDDFTPDLSAEEFYARLLKFKGDDPSKILPVGVISPIEDLGCKSDDGGKPFKLTKFLAKSGGRILSVCDRRFGPKLADIGIDLSGHVSPRRVIPLSAVPAENSIEVRYGTQLVKRNYESGWTYIPYQNAVTLSPDLDVKREPGAQVSIKFTPVQE